MTLSADYGATEIATAAPAPAPVPDGVVYVADAAGRPVRVTVLERICHDTMTGMPRPFTVKIEFDGRTLDGCGGEPASLLRGGAWIVESIDGAPVLPDARPTVFFGDDGSVSGHASCNGYSGTYTLTGEGLAVTGLLSTMKACPPPFMGQEDALLAILRDVMRFERPPDGALVLHTSGGRTIRASRGK
jgi:heat shock protein HslJ